MGGGHFGGTGGRAGSPPYLCSPPCSRYPASRYFGPVLYPHRNTSIYPFIPLYYKGLTAPVGLEALLTRIHRAKRLVEKHISGTFFIVCEGLEINVLNTCLVVFLTGKQYDATAGIVRTTRKRLVAINQMNCLGLLFMLGCFAYGLLEVLLSAFCTSHYNSCRS